MMKDLKVRSLTSFVILLAVAGFVALRFVSTYFFDAFILMISFIATYEIVKANYDHVPNKSAYIVFAFSFVCASYLPFLFSSAPFYLLLYESLLFVLYFISSMLVELLYLGKNRKNQELTQNPESLLQTTIITLKTMCYPTILLCALYGINDYNVKLGTVALILLFGVTMFTDVFAYIFGSLIRGPKLVPQISPKKSISGACFGLLGGVVFSGLSLWLLYFENILNVSYGNYSSTGIILFFVIVGFVGSIITQFGDLMASAIKRKNNIKDFGSIFPGHGGVMDRIDGLMFTAVLIYLIMFIVF